MVRDSDNRLETGLRFGTMPTNRAIPTRDLHSAYQLSSEIVQVLRIKLSNSQVSWPCGMNSSIPLLQLHRLETVHQVTFGLVLLGMPNPLLVLLQASRQEVISGISTISQIFCAKNAVVEEKIGGGKAMFCREMRSESHSSPVTFLSNFSGLLGPELLTFC